MILSDEIYFKGLIVFEAYPVVVTTGAAVAFGLGAAVGTTFGTAGATLAGATLPGAGAG
jgi:hypothetical protein